MNNPSEQLYVKSPLSARIALIDDDADLLEGIAHTLAPLGTCTKFFSGEAFLLKINEQPNAFDAAVLDWGLPNMQGIDVIRQLRQSHAMPVVFLTSRDSETDIVAALNAGADDFVVKPYAPAMLQARVRAALRRVPQTPHAIAMASMPSTVKANHITCEFTINGQRSEALTEKEFKLAVILFNNLGKPVSRDAIFAHVWGDEVDTNTRTLDTHISRIRTRLNLRPENQWRLSPVYSFGYRLDHLI